MVFCGLYRVWVLMVQEICFGGARDLFWWCEKTVLM
jgi:hypothetical protein